MPGSATERHLLYVEDNPGDVYLMRTLAGKLSYSCTALEDGEDALRFIDSQPFRPDVIVLDVNIPKIDGLTVLAALKSDAGLKSIPVLVLVQPKSPDAARAEALKADLCLPKPLDWAGYLELGAVICGLCGDPALAATAT